MLQLSDFYSKYTTTPAIAQKRVEHGSVIPLRWKLYYPAVSNTDKHTASALEQQWQCNGPHAILDRCTLTCKLLHEHLHRSPVCPFNPKKCVLETAK